MTATFPQAPLAVQVGLMLTAGAWTDITSYAYNRDESSPPVKITRGRPDELSQATAGTMTLQLNNRDSRFSAQNPSGPYYGQIGKNTPIRLSVPDQATYLRLEGDTLSSAACPDASGLQITGDLDLRLDLRLTGWAQGTLASKWTSFGTSNSWFLQLDNDGTLTWAWTAAGTTAAELVSAVPLPAVSGRFALRVTFQVSTATATFYTGPAGGAAGSTWTQLGPAVTGSAPATLFGGAGTSVAVGNYSPAGFTAGVSGSVWEMVLMSGVGGTIVAHPVFDTQTAGATSFTDALSNTWTMNGTAELSARIYRFHGELSSSPKAQDPSGADVWVPVQCGGLLRRIQQGTAPVQSAMRRGILAQAGTLYPVAYWPCEDASGATSAGSAVGGPPMAVSSQVQMASDSASFAASSALPVMNNGTMSGTVPAYTSNGSLIVRFLLNVTAQPAAGAFLGRVAVVGGTASGLYCYYGTGGALGFRGVSGAGSTVFDTGLIGFGVVAEPVWVSLELQPGSGGTVDYSITVLQPGATVGETSPPASYTGTIGDASAVYPGAGAGLGQVTMGHWQVQSAWQSLFNLAGPLDAWDGEAAASRFARVCGENGISSRIIGPPQASVLMGPQPIDTLVNILQQCEDADRGLIFEPAQAYALGYRTLASMCAQSPAAVVSWTGSELDAAGFQPPADDDQYTVNDAVVSRSSGGSAGVTGTTYEYALNDGSQLSISAPPVGAGDYQQTFQVNVLGDAEVPHIASWIVNVGTATGNRFPAIPLNLARAELAALFYALLYVVTGDYVQVTPVPSWVSPNTVSQIVPGGTEEIGGFFLNLSWNAIPEKPYEVLLAGSGATTDCRADATGSALEAAATSAAAWLLVTTTQGLPGWTTAVADLPFDVVVSGERITVTGVSPAGNWLAGEDCGFEGGIGSWAANTNCAVAASTAQAHSGSGSMAMTSTAAGVMSALAIPFASITALGMPCAPGDTVTASAWFLAATSARNCLVGAQFFTSAGAFISTLTGSSQADSTAAWAQATASLTAPATAAYARPFAQVNSTGAGGELHYVDDVTLADASTFPAAAQRLVVTRSVNGVAKAQASGAAVSLFSPVVWALT